MSERLVMDTGPFVALARGGDGATLVRVSPR